ncbi:MAG: hypothetical protein JWP71_2861 [Mucilaginibacter sp.]|nr:hypothetical protein [Mucilaginibacter sp.]
MFIPLTIVGVLAVIFVITQAWGGLAIIMVAALFIIHMLATTYYTITDNELHVRSGFIINQTIVINTIKKIATTNSFLSSPALSLDRLEVFYNTYDSVVISPKDKAGFIASLKAVNPQIEVSEVER